MINKNGFALKVKKILKQMDKALLHRKSQRKTLPVYTVKKITQLVLKVGFLIVIATGAHITHMLV